MKVAVVVDSDAFGGAEVWTGRVLAHLPADVRASVVVPGPVAGRLAVPDGVERVVVPLARHRERSPEVAAALAALSPDVVHVNLVDPGSNRAALRAALDRAPTVVTLHLHGAAPRPALTAEYGAPAAAIAPSAAIAAQLTELGAAPERVVRVRHGVPAARDPGPGRPAGRRS